MARLVADQDAGDARGSLNAGPKRAHRQRTEYYLERVAKYVPVEVIMVYLAIRSFAPPPGPSAWPPILEFVIYGALVVATCTYLLKVGGTVPQKTMQVIIGTVSFIVWTYGIGGPFFFAALGSRVGVQLEHSGFAGAVVAVWSLFVGAFKPK